MGYHVVRLQVAKERREEIKKFPYNGKWFPALLANTAKHADSKENAFWCVTEDCDFSQMDRTFLPVQPFSISGLYAYLCNNLSYYAPPVSIEADVHDFYIIQIHGIDIYMIHLIDNHNLQQKLMVMVPLPLFREKAIHPDSIDNKRLKITGTVHLYSNATHSLEFQIRAFDIEIIGESSYRTDLAKWEEEGIAKGLIPPITNAEQKNGPYTLLFRTIGVIAPENSRGYNDFMDKLKEKPRQIFESDIVPKLITDKFSYDKIIEKITEFNKEKSCDVICIIRGGGDREQLIEYSRPELLQAIHDSAIPIITGIAHYDDILLCDRAAFYGARTPTDAADYLNTVKRVLKKESRKKALQAKEESNKQELRNAQEQTTSWQARYEMVNEQYVILKAQYKEAQAKISELQQQIHSLQLSMSDTSSHTAKQEGILGTLKHFLGK